MSFQHLYNPYCSKNIIGIVVVYLGWKRSKSSGRRHVDFSAEITCPAYGLTNKYPPLSGNLLWTIREYTN